MTSGEGRKRGRSWCAGPLFRTNQQRLLLGEANDPHKSPLNKRASRTLHSTSSVSIAFPNVRHKAVRVIFRIA
jgi:hypothetical protein